MSTEDLCQLHPEEPPINFDQPTWELVMAERRRGALLNSVTVATMSDIGTIEYRNIPTRSYWLSMVLDDWGSTDEEIKDSIASDNLEVFVIEVCGWHSGCGVILRDSYRNPIIVISKAGNLSLFYHELQGVSLGLKLTLKYEFFYFDFDCISEVVAEYVRQSWAWKDRCGCAPRDDPEDPRKKKHYCVECSRWRLHQIGEGKNADKILLLIDEIFYDALEFERQGDSFFVLSNTSLSKAQGVWHLANMGKDQELRIDEIDRHEEIAEILYKDVYGHGSEEELKFLYDFEKREEESKQQLYEARMRAGDEARMRAAESS